MKIEQLETPLIDIKEYSENGASLKACINHTEKSIYLYDWKSEKPGKGYFRDLLAKVISTLYFEYGAFIITAECENSRSSNIAAEQGDVVKSLIMYEF